VVSSPRTSLVCFQPYTDSMCSRTLGAKQCSPQGRCTHTDSDSSVGYEQSTLQQCSRDGVHIQVYDNSSACRPGAEGASLTTAYGECVNMGGIYGRLSCGVFPLCYLGSGRGLPIEN
jgi:hypothetical protein